MTIDFTKLDPTFVPLLQQLLQNMQDLGHTVDPYYGIRTLEEQAKLWRQSRTTAQVNAEIAMLQANGALYAASVMQSVGPQPNGPQVTHTYLYSYHLIGKACYIFVDGDTSGGPVYDVLATEALKVGLTPGRNWPEPATDSDHVQLGNAELAATYTLAQMDEILKELA
jgi:peptidoglycan LD-endopeptidase CwlK